MTLADYTVIGVPPDLTEAEFVAILDAAHSPALGAASAVWNYCRRRGVSPAFLLAMFRHESGYGLKGTATQTHSWGNTRSPSFGGVPEMGTVPGRSGTFPVFKDWIDGGISTAARWLDYAPYRDRTTVRQIIGIWAPVSDGNEPEIYSKAVLASIEEWTKGAPPVAPRIAIAAGHHNTDGGNSFEQQQTGELAEAVARHCRRLGFDVAVLTPDGPDADTDRGDGQFPGGLWDVALAAAALVPPPAIFLECHTEGGGTTGVFAIYPDWGTDVDTDVRDTLGPLASKKIAAATGLALRRAGKDGKPGVCSEKETGVGLSGSRLGIFNKSAAIAATSTRLIIEYGAHDKEPDLAIVKLPSFYDAAGKATAEAFAEFLGLHTDVTPDPPVIVPTDPIVARSYIDANGVPTTEIKWGGEMVEILGTDFVNVGIRGRNAAGDTFHRSIIDGEGKEYVKE